MYSQIRSCVMVHGITKISDPSRAADVRQGQHLSLFHYSIYLNDLETFLDEAKCNCCRSQVDDNTVSSTLCIITVLNGNYLYKV